MLIRIMVIALLMMAVVAGYLMVVHAEEPKESKEPVWGNPTDGLTIAVNFTRPQYTLGGEAEFTVDIKNASNTAMNVIRSNPYAQYRMALYDQDGHPIAKAKLVLEEEKRRQNPGGEVSRFTSEQLAPGQTTREMFSISNWFKIEKAGTYQLMVMRQIDSSWEKGCAISNLVKVEITKPKE